MAESLKMKEGCGSDVLLRALRGERQAVSPSTAFRALGCLSTRRSLYKVFPWYSQCPLGPVHSYDNIFDYVLPFAVLDIPVTILSLPTGPF